MIREDRFDDLEEMVKVTAAVLASKGYQAENPQASEDEADAYGVENYMKYVEDAWDVVLEMAKEKKEGQLPFWPSR